MCLGGGIIEQVCRCRSDYYLYLKQGSSERGKNYYDITLALAGICQSARLGNNSLTRGIVMAMRYTSHSTYYRYEPQLNAGGFWRQRSQPRVGLETLLGVLNASSRQGLTPN